MKDAAASAVRTMCQNKERRKMSHIFSCFYKKKLVLVQPGWCSGTAGILTFRSCMQILHVMGERGNFSWQSTHTKRPAPRGDRSHGINFLAWCCCYRAMQNTHKNCMRAAAAAVRHGKMSCDTHLQAWIYPRKMSVPKGRNQLRRRRRHLKSCAHKQ